MVFPVEKKTLSEYFGSLIEFKNTKLFHGTLNKENPTHKSVMDKNKYKDKRNIDLRC